MSYRKIEPSMWDDERFAPLSKDAKLAWLCILTGPHTTPLPGLFVCGIATLSESLRDDIDTVSKALKELGDAGLVRFNPTTRVMQVPNAPKYNPCANPKVLKGWFTVWKGVPDCAEKYAHIQRVRAALDESQAWVQTAWSATFGTVRVPDRYRTDTVSDTVSISGASAGASTGAGGGAGSPASAEPTPSAHGPATTPTGRSLLDAFRDAAGSRATLVGNMSEERGLARMLDRLAPSTAEVQAMADALGSPAAWWPPGKRAAPKHVTLRDLAGWKEADGEPGWAPLSALIAHVRAKAATPAAARRADPAPVFVQLGRDCKPLHRGA